LPGVLRGGLKKGEVSPEVLKKKKIEKKKEVFKNLFFFSIA